MWKDLYSVFLSNLKDDIIGLMDREGSESYEFHIMKIIVLLLYTMASLILNLI